MYLIREQYKTIARYLPLPRGNITINNNYQALNAILYVA